METKLSCGVPHPPSLVGTTTAPRSVSHAGHCKSESVHPQPHLEMKGSSLTLPAALAGTHLERNEATGGMSTL